MDVFLLQILISYHTTFNCVTFFNQITPNLLHKCHVCVFVCVWGTVAMFILHLHTLICIEKCSGSWIINRTWRLIRILFFYLGSIVQDKCRTRTHLVERASLPICDGEQEVSEKPGPNYEVWLWRHQTTKISISPSPCHVQ